MSVGTLNFPSAAARGEVSAKETSEIRQSTEFLTGSRIHSVTLTNKSGATAWAVLIRGSLPVNGAAWASVGSIIGIVEADSGDGLQPASFDFGSAGYPVGSDGFSVLLVENFVIGGNIDTVSFGAAGPSVCAVAYS